jgi:hypothetical protein
MPVDRLSEAQPEASVAGRDAMERTQRGTAFYVKTSGETGFYSLARDAAVFDITSPWNLSAADNYGSKRPISLVFMAPSPERLATAKCENRRRA